MAQIITPQKAKLGPDNNTTVCICIYIYLSLFLSQSLSLSLLLSYSLTLFLSLSGLGMTWPRGHSAGNRCHSCLACLKAACTLLGTLQKSWICQKNLKISSEYDGPVREIDSRMQLPESGS